MKQKLFAALAFVSLCLVILITAIEPGRTEQAVGDLKLPDRGIPNSQTVLPSTAVAPPIGCAVQPQPQTANLANREAKAFLQPVPPAPPLTLARFRTLSQEAAAPSPASSRPPLTLSMLRSGRSYSSSYSPSYSPREEIALADATNYGDRFLRDVHGRPATYAPIVVLHETVGSAESAIHFFQTPHPRDEDQSSYHTLIKRDGTVVYIVPPDKRAFGAGNSVFESPDGIEAVQTNPQFPPSVNNFAYHISLETPPDGNNNNNSHSGYTSAQYQSLAWLVAKTNVPDARLTTHKMVDRSGSRKDPRSFNAQVFLRQLSAYPKTQEIAIGCPNTAVNP